MMRLNNKGISLIELLVSIVLVGIVLVFLVQLLVDLRTETENNSFVYNNQVNRTDAIYTIQNDLSLYSLIGIKDTSLDNDLTLKFYFRKNNENKEAILTIDSSTTENEVLGTTTKYYLRYTSVDGEKYSWEMKGAEVDTCGAFTYYYDTQANNYFFKLNIYLYNKVYHERNNKDKNNAVDDIEITYAAALGDLEITNNSYLTNGTIGYKNVGYCTN